MTYVLSDIHGYYTKYQAVLETIQFSSADTLYILGDVIDRGPDGVKILLDMMARPNIVPILGNHEFTAAMCLPWLMEEVTDQSLDSLGPDQLAVLSEWLTNGGGTTLRELKRLDMEEREELLEYVREMDLYAEVEAGGRHFVLVHAGLDHFAPDKPLEDYKLTDFLFGRPNLRQSCFNDKFLVFGHTPTRLLRQEAEEAPSDRIYRQGNLIAIDCGCGFGGLLGCLCLDTMEEFYV